MRKSSYIPVLFAFSLPCLADYVILHTGGYTQLTVPQSVNLIWYGDFSALPLYRTVMPQFIADMPAFARTRILSAYVSAAPSQRVTTSFAIGSQAFIAVSGTYGTTLGTAQTQQMITDAVAGGLVSAPVSDFASIYAVIPGPNILVTPDFCGVHSTMTVNGKAVSTILLHDFMDTGSYCNAGTNAVTGSAATDTATTLFFHELAEAATYGYYTADGMEIADLCQIFGSAQTAPNGFLFNELVNGRYYYLQEIWSQIPPPGNVGQCAGAAAFPTLLMIGKLKPGGAGTAGSRSTLPRR